MDGFYAAEVDGCKGLMVQPLVSFLMSVRNDTPILNQCLETLSQQTYENIEIIIVLDSASALAEKKVRIAAQQSLLFRIIENPNPKNLSRSLNLGVSHCKGEYIARIDADDICTLDRIAIQVEAIESLGKDFAIVGSRAKGLHFENEEDTITLLIPKDFNRTNPLIHPSILVRREILEEFKYDERYRFSQDYELWTRIIKYHGIGILNRKLIEFDKRERDPKYVLTQEFYFLKANLRFLFFSIKPNNSGWNFKEFFETLCVNLIRQKNLAKNWIRLAIGRFKG
jgi:glycosyltransferase involved in cell wall biosynthesis